jgi:hypothetical protein
MFRRLLAGAVLAASVAAPLRAAEVDPVLPAETESVVYVNVRQILDSELVKKYARAQIEQFLKGQEAQQTLKKLGLDPLKDINQVTVGSWGKGPEDMQAVFDVRGKFDPEKLFKAAQEEAKTKGDEIAIVEEGKYKLIKMTPKNEKKTFYVAVANEKTIVGATQKKLAVNAIEATEKAGKSQLKKELAELVQKQDEKASLYAVGVVAGRIEGVQIPQGLPGVDPMKLSKQLEKMQTVALTLRLTNDVNLNAVMGMKSTDAADDFGESVKQLLGTVKQFLPLLAGQQPQAKPLVDEITKTLKSTVKGKDVQVSLKLTADAIGKAAGGAGD